MGRTHLPRARAVTGVNAHTTMGSRLRRMREAMAPATRDALELAVGLWPLWVLTGAGAGLVWFLAMTQSP